MVRLNFTQLLAGSAGICFYMYQIRFRNKGDANKNKYPQMEVRDWSRCASACSRNATYGHHSCHRGCASEGRGG